MREGFGAQTFQQYEKAGLVALPSSPLVSAHDTTMRQTKFRAHALFKHMSKKQLQHQKPCLHAAVKARVAPTTVQVASTPLVGWVSKLAHQNLLVGTCSRLNIIIDRTDRSELQRSEPNEILEDTECDQPRTHDSCRDVHVGGMVLVADGQLEVAFLQEANLLKPTQFSCCNVTLFSKRNLLSAGSLDLLQREL